MDSYIVRIYRRDSKNPDFLVGVVEQVGMEGNLTFKNPDELWSILTCEEKKANRKE